jgi:endonuclease/exonuclease/phosphatase family metal-dependent hydrolase
VELPEGQPLDLLGLHLHARETLGDEAERLKELAGVFDIAAKLPQGHLLAGDFNATHPAQIVDLATARPKTRARVATQDHQLPRDAIAQVLARGYVDTHALHHPPEAFQTTFTTSHPAMRVDYIFATRDLAARVRSCEAFKPEMARFASDHFPMVAVIE